MNYKPRTRYVTIQIDDVSRLDISKAELEEYILDAVNCWRNGGNPDAIVMDATFTLVHRRGPPK